MVAAFKPLRPRSLRYQAENAHLEEWLAIVQRVAATHYDLAVEVAAARNLVKGYGDTNERGRARFDTLDGAAAGARRTPRRRRAAWRACARPRTRTTPARRWMRRSRR